MSTVASDYLSSFIFYCHELCLMLILSCNPEMLVVEELYQEAVVNTTRKLIIFNGELDRIRSGCILFICSSKSLMVHVVKLGGCINLKLDGSHYLLTNYSDIHFTPLLFSAHLLLFHLIIFLTIKKKKIL